MKYFDGCASDESPPCRLGSRCLCVGLPRRQRHVLHGLLSADSEKSAMLRHRLNPQTAHVHVKAIYKRFKVNGRVELLLAAIDKAANTDQKLTTPGERLARLQAQASALLALVAPAAAGLGPRHRKVFTAFLSSNHEKQMARQTGLSQDAFHELGQTVYRRFGVRGMVALLSLVLDQVASAAEVHRSPNVVRSSICT